MRIALVRCHGINEESLGRRYRDANINRCCRQDLVSFLDGGNHDASPSRPHTAHADLGSDLIRAEASAGGEGQAADYVGLKESGRRSVLCNGLVFTEKWRLGPQPAGGPIPLSRKQLFAEQVLGGANVGVCPMFPGGEYDRFSGRGLASGELVQRLERPPKADTRRARDGGVEVNVLDCARS